MAAVVASVEIARRPVEVFPYPTNFSCFPAWQQSVSSVEPVTIGPPAVRARGGARRRVGPRTVEANAEVNEFNPPRTLEVRSFGGLPVEAMANGDVKPLDDGTYSKITLSLDFEGHPVGRLLLPLDVRRSARRVAAMARARPQGGARTEPVRSTSRAGRRPMTRKPQAGAN